MALTSEDRRSVGEALLRQIGYADTIVAIGADPVGNALVERPRGRGSTRLDGGHRCDARYLFTGQHHARRHGAASIHPTCVAGRCPKARCGRSSSSRFGHFTRVGCGTAWCVWASADSSAVVTSGCPRVRNPYAAGTAPAANPASVAVAADMAGRAAPGSSTQELVPGWLCCGRRSTTRCCVPTRRRRSGPAEATDSSRGWASTTTRSDPVVEPHPRLPVREGDLLPGEDRPEPDEVDDHQCDIATDDC